MEKNERSVEKEVSDVSFIIVESCEQNVEFDTCSDQEDVTQSEFHVELEGKPQLAKTETDVIDAGTVSTI